MDADVLSTFAIDGVYILDRYLNGSIVSELLAAFDTLNQSPQLATAAGSALEKRGAKFARRNLLTLDFIQQFLSSAPVTSLLNLFGPDLMPVRAILFNKAGDANWTVPWHQDKSIAVAARLDASGYGPWSTKAGVVHVQPPIDILREMITFRVSLDPCGPDNGPLRVIPGSHRSILTPEQVEGLCSVEHEFACSTEAGGVVIMRPLLLHASSPAKAGNHRRVLHVEFGPRSLSGGLRWARV
jgi:hypothetical protein